MIKILFATGGIGEVGSYDYITDGVFHGFKSRPDLFDVYECPSMSQLYKDTTVPHSLSLFGRRNIIGSPNELSWESSKEMISDRVFDLLVFDWRTSDPWWKDRGLSPHFSMTQELSEIAFLCYEKERIVFLDGSDDPTQQPHDPLTFRFVDKSVYFKRELYSDDPKLNPIGMSFPADRMFPADYPKTKVLATVIPDEKQTYIFNDEESYYSDYGQSLFGFTWKKLGWDCFRHYEIIFSSCIPLFMGIDECPPRTMHKFPKSLCHDVLNKGIVIPGWQKWQKYPNMASYRNLSVDSSKVDKNWYYDTLSKFRDHALNNLTTHHMSDYVLSRTGIY